MPSANFIFVKIFRWSRLCSFDDKNHSNFT